MAGADAGGCCVQSASHVPSAVSLLPRSLSISLLQFCRSGCSSDLLESDVVGVLAEATTAHHQAVLADQAVSAIAHAAIQATRSTPGDSSSAGPGGGGCWLVVRSLASLLWWSPDQARESGPNLRGCALQVAWTPMMTKGGGGGTQRERRTVPATEARDPSLGRARETTQTQNDSHSFAIVSDIVYIENEGEGLQTHQEGDDACINLFPPSFLFPDVSDTRLTRQSASGCEDLNGAQSSSRATRQPAPLWCVLLHLASLPSVLRVSSNWSLSTGLASPSANSSASTADLLVSSAPHLTTRPLPR